jgi:predicted HicB family RNase H-like nuclease
VIKETNKDFYKDAPENRFVAHLKEIPEGSLYDYGKTQEEAIQNLHAQFKNMQKEFLNRKLSFPEPERKGLKNYSGRLVLRIPRWLHKCLAEFASDEEISLNSYIMNKLVNTTATEELFKSFCRFQQKLIDELPYKFRLSIVRSEERIINPAKVLKLDQYSKEYKKDYRNVGT